MLFYLYEYVLILLSRIETGCRNWGVSSTRRLLDFGMNVIWTDPPPRSRVTTDCVVALFKLSRNIESLLGDLHEPVKTTNSVSLISTRLNREEELDGLKIRENPDNLRTDTRGNNNEE